MLYAVVEIQFRWLHSRDLRQIRKHVEGRERNSAHGRRTWSPTASEEEEESGRPPCLRWGDGFWTPFLSR